MICVICFYHNHYLSVLVWVYCTLAESAFSPSLLESVTRVPEWRGYVDVFPAAVLYRGYLLPRTYKTMKKAFSNFWSSTVRIERRERSRVWYFVQ